MYLLEVIMRTDKESVKKNLEHSPSRLNKLFENIVERLSDSGLKAVDNSSEMVKKAIDDAIELEQAAEQMSSDEASLLSAYIARDIKSLAGFFHRGGEGVAAWMNFDLDYLESASKEQFLKLADNTVLDNLLLNEKLHSNDQQYLRGEVCLQGTLRCLNCQNEHRVLKIETIAACNECGSEYFERVSRDQ
jgi:hypothetical protein